MIKVLRALPGKRRAGGLLRLGLAASLGILATASSAQAQADVILPGLHSVVGVAADDELNVRAEPKADASILSTLPADAVGVEVIRLDATGRWGLVNTVERSGWVAMRFLRADPMEMGEEGLPARLRCYGTEPFWSLEWQDGTLAFATPEDEARPVTLDKVLQSNATREPHWVLIGQLGARRMTGVVEPKQCSDGMSDRAYGLGMTLISEEAGQDGVLRGCCSLQP